MQRFLWWSLLLAGLGLAQAETLLKVLPAPGPDQGLYAWGLTFVNGHLVVGDDYTGTLSVVDTATGQVLETLGFPYPSNHGLAFDGEALWVAPYRWDSRYLYRMSLNGTLLDSLYVPDFAAGDYVGGLAWDGEALWVSIYYPNTYPNLYRVDPNTGIAVDTIPAGGLQPLGLAYGNGSLWNAMDDNDGDPEWIWELDPATGTPLQHFESPTGHPRGLAWDGEALWLVAAAPPSWNGGFALYRIDPYGPGTPRLSAPVTFVNFGQVTVSDTAWWDLQVQNTGTAPLVLGPAENSEPAFFLGNPLPDTVPAGATELLHFGFAPQAPGAYLDTLWLATNDPLWPRVGFHLQGEGLATGPQIFLPETLVDYGTPRARAFVRHWLPVVNPGNAPLEIYALNTDPADRWRLWPEPDLPLTVAPGDTLLLPLWYHATPQPDSNLAPGQLRIVSNDPAHDTARVILQGGWRAGGLEEGAVIWQLQVSGDLWTHFRAVRLFEDLNGDGVAEVLGSSENDTLYCVNGNADGPAEVLWRFSYGTTYTERGLLPFADMDGDGTRDVLLGTVWGDRAVHAISGRTGQPLWTFDTHAYGQGGWVYEVAPFVDLTGDGVPEALAATGDDSYNTGPRSVFCLNGATGEMVWQALTGYAVFGTRAIADLNGDSIPEVACGTGDGSPDAARVFLLDGATGTSLWQVQSPLDAVWTVEPLADLDEDGVPDIVAGSNLGVFALSSATGQVLWSFNAGSFCTDLDLVPDQNNDEVPEVVPSGTVSHGYLLDGRTGQLLWLANTPDMVFAAAVAPIDTVYPDASPVVVFGTGYTNNALFGVQASDGTPVFSWPQGAPVEDVQVVPSVDLYASPDYLVGLRDGRLLMINGTLPYAVEESPGGTPGPGLRVLTPVVRQRLEVQVPGPQILLIFDAAGRRVLRRRVSGGRVALSLSGLPAGVYFLTTPEKHPAARFVVLP